MNRIADLKVLIKYVIVLLFLSLLVIFSAGCSRAPKTNVLLITLDTTRADRIGEYGYKKDITPNIDALARQGVLFETALTQVPLTLPSHCTIMTGTAVPYHKVRTNGSYFLPEALDTLAEILKRNNYHTSAFISSFTVDSRFGIAQGFDVYNQNLDVRGGEIKAYSSERRAEKVYNDFAEWFGKKSDDPFFSWVHFYDPHDPYEPPEPFASKYKDNPYDGEIAYMDQYVGKILDLLKSKGVLENTLVVIVGDHGEAFGEHGEFGHQVFCYEENLRVPFIIAGKQLPKDKRIARRVDIMSVMPTILDILDIQVPKKIQGDSLLPLVQGEQLKHKGFYFESKFGNEAMGCAEIKGWLELDYKYIHVPQPELYNLEKDPLEKNNLYAGKEAVAMGMKRKMEDYIKKTATAQFDSGRKMSAAEIKKLESLGYLTSSGNTSSSGNLPDAKTLIQGWSHYLKGNEMLRTQDKEEAIRHYTEAVRLNPGFTWPYSRLAFLYSEKGDNEKAGEMFKEGIKRNPNDHILKLDYANFLIAQSNQYDAFHILNELEKVESLDISAAINLAKGKMLLSRGKYRDALPYYEKVLELEPENESIKETVSACHFNIAVSSLQQGDNEAAVTHFKKVLEFKQPPAVYYNMAAALARLERWQEACDALQGFIDRYPQDDQRKQEARDLLQNWRQKI